MMVRGKHIPGFVIPLAVVVILIGILAAGMTVYGATYKDRVLPGVQMGDIPVGGMNKQQLRNFLQEMNDKLMNEGIQIVADKKTFILYPVLDGVDNSVEFVTMDIDQEVENILQYGKTKSAFQAGFSAASSGMTKPKMKLQTVTVDEARIAAAVKGFISEVEHPPTQAKLFVKSIEPLTYTIVSSTPGIVVDDESIPSRISDEWESLRIPDIVLSLREEGPSRDEEIYLRLFPKLELVLSAGPIELTYTDPRKPIPVRWTIQPTTFANWLTVMEQDEQEVFALSTPSTTEYLQETIASAVNISAQNAKFDVGESGRVTVFQASRSGTELDVQKTFEAINAVFIRRSLQQESMEEPPIELVTEESAPDVPIGEMNNFGIAEVLGVGVSRFAGSPANRISNIRNAVAKLNGVLIKPGEEFSAIAHTLPFTLEGGYLPELVILGDEVKPEIGGGLCQISTTLFRMAMNSGMPITQRRNHSLVVLYYNDLSNGIPGTDATIYDPSPDFRFLNDTGHYVLIQTDIDLKKQELYFTLWGTNDGRKGWYTPPVLHRWIPHGATKTIETTDLPPGTTKCQHAYTGADASFTYHRILPSGEKEERVFDSHYKPLPEICLVGVEAPPEPTEKELEEERFKTFEEQLQAGFEESQS